MKATFFAPSLAIRSAIDVIINGGARLTQIAQFSLRSTLGEVTGAKAIIGLFISFATTAVKLLRYTPPCQ
jgi:hypothetical protein